MRRRPVAVLAASHIASDLSQGALPAMLPVLIAERHLSYSVAAALVMSISLTTSSLQPLFGWISDRKSTIWLAPAGLLIAGIGIALTGVAPNYACLIAAAGLSGVGLAAFHPEGARLIHHVSGWEQGMGMSLFSVGGNLGFALGPMLTTGIIALSGLRGSLLLIFPAILMTAILTRELGAIQGSDHAAGKASISATNRTQEDEWRPFSLLMTSVICRSIVFFGLNTFLPLYWIDVFGTSREMGSVALSVFLFSGAAGTLIGGKLADRFQRTHVIAHSLLLVLPLMIGLLVTQHAALAVLILAPLGMTLFAPFSVMVVLGQEYLPNRVGIASGLTIGLAGSVGGLAAPAFGALADYSGLRAALSALLGLAVIAAALAYLLPSPAVFKRSLESEKIGAEI